MMTKLTPMTHTWTLDAPQGTTKRRTKGTRSLFLAALAIATLSSHGGSLRAEEKEAKEGDMSKCPVMGAQAGPNRATAAGAMSNGDWWPEQLNLKILHQNSAKGNPMDKGFNYAAEFKKLDLAALKKDIEALMIT